MLEQFYDRNDLRNTVESGRIPNATQKSTWRPSSRLDSVRLPANCPPLRDKCLHSQPERSQACVGRFAVANMVDSVEPTQKTVLISVYQTTICFHFLTYQTTAKLEPNSGCEIYSDLLWPVGFLFYQLRGSMAFVSIVNQSPINNRLYSYSSCCTLLGLFDNQLWKWSQPES